MFWEPQNTSLHHEGGEILLPVVAESECTNCKQYEYMQKPTTPLCLQHMSVVGYLIYSKLFWNFYSFYL